ncbi:hypothetical protein ACKI1Z_40980, partial [Streptomyces galilaeus]|uniref:hypothetical protein n=1 Tax=Streptomyces galilaeus TaxID=33899 RepID=UPI0038F7FC21
IPMDNVLWQAAQIIETDTEHEYATAVGIPIRPYMEYMESRNVTTRPQIDATLIPEDLREEYSKPSEKEYRFDKWVLIGRSKDKDEPWALITYASTREF